jgi:hypothetical protein
MTKEPQYHVQHMSPYVLDAINAKTRKGLSKITDILYLHPESGEDVEVQIFTEDGMLHDSHIAGENTSGLLLKADQKIRELLYTK